MKGNNRELKPFLDMLTEMLNDTRVPKTVKIYLHCPYCDQKAIGGAQGNHLPKEGNATICPYCFNMLCFNESMGVVKFTPETWQALGEKTQRKLRSTQQGLIEKKSKPETEL